MLHVYECSTCPVSMVVGEDLPGLHGSPPASQLSGRTHCPVCGISFQYMGPQEEKAVVSEESPAEESKPRRGRPRKDERKNHHKHQAEGAGEVEERAQAEQEEPAKKALAGAPWRLAEDGGRVEDI